MHTINIDFETYSEIDLIKQGAYKYINHPSFEILCMAYSIDFKEVKIWRTFEQLPQEVIEAFNDSKVIIRGWNVGGFERLILDKEMNQLKIKNKIPYDRYIDTQALSLYYAMPASLDAAGQALNVLKKKDKKGTYLIQKLCKPKKWSKAAPFTRYTFKIAPDDFIALYEYCMRDVEAEVEILNSLPFKELPELEQNIFLFTLYQNDRGLTIDVELVKSIICILETWKESKIEELKKLTDSRVSTGNQRDRIIDFILSQGYKIKGLTANIVKEALQDPKAPENVKQILKLRQYLSRSSTAKFEKMIELADDNGIVRGNLQYHGASTGRFAGRGMQIQNFPRASFAEEEKLINAFKTSLEAVQELAGGNLMYLASCLLRACIIAPKGGVLVVSDFSAIENRVLHWLAGDLESLQDFRNGKDQYKNFASTLYNVNYDSVSKQQRMMGKIAILGLGYQMGYKTFINHAKNF